VSHYSLKFSSSKTSLHITFEANGQYLKVILSDIEKKIIDGNLKNDKEVLKEYILNLDSSMYI
jgi:hypothetical protein